VLAVVGQVEFCECGTLSNPSDDKSRESREKVSYGGNVRPLCTDARCC
jgi:hypothetical protein